MWMVSKRFQAPLHAVQMVNRGGVAEMCSLLLLIGQETEQKISSRPAEAESAEAPADADKPSTVAGSSSSGGGTDKPHSSYSGAPPCETMRRRMH